MSDQERAENLMRALVIECCPQAFPVSNAPAVAFGNPEAALSFDWSKLLSVLKVILPVIIDLLTKTPNP